MNPTSLSFYILTQNSHPRVTLQWCSTIPGAHCRRLQTSTTKTWMSTALTVLSHISMHSFEVQLSSEINVCPRRHQARVTCWEHSVQSTALKVLSLHSRCQSPSASPPACLSLVGVLRATPPTEGASDLETRIALAARPSRPVLA